ncbi:cytochrome P450 [Cyanobium sp. FACHB-13342]|uniref:cytochrome P450 n=1 Tax=Cyanobium sp. FACHB-13342 TaxID=2692793 RepID=UPI0016809D48|nr:cytochrome P450 [Cyanobium sp. FACHB-13342]MBD2422620.1 cytochrome P450 [Cyanobium sp. FACHB-13342]
MSDEPIYPHPEPYTPNFLRRIRRGLYSWFGLLNEWDFRIPVGALRFMGLNLLLVNEPTAVRQVMVSAVEDFPKHPYTLWILEPLIGRAIFSVNGAEWAQQRRLVDQAFQVAQLQRVYPQMEGAVAASLVRLEAQVDEGPIDADAEMTLVTADVIVRTILSRPLEGEEAEAIFAAFARYQKRAGRALMLRFLRLPRQRLQAYLATHATPIRAWIAAAIDRRLTAPAGQNATPNDTPSPTDLLDALIAARDPDTGEGFSRDGLVDQVCFLFLAGHETSASALGMAVYLLGRFPEVQQRLRAEVLQVLGSRAGAPDRPLGFEDLRQLSYGAAVFNETLRLYPPVSFFIRESQVDTELAGSRCPMRALVTLSPWVIQRHDQHWSEPNAFRPERFLTDTPGEANSPDDRRWARDAFLPYGLGPRKCPGAAFAQQEALLVLAELVRRFEVLPDPEHEPELVARLTLRSRNGIRVRLVRRSLRSELAPEAPRVDAPEWQQNPVQP